MKIGIAVSIALAAVIVLALAIVVMAWIKGGVQPAQMVEIPVEASSAPAGGA